MRRGGRIAAAAGIEEAMSGQTLSFSEELEREVLLPPRGCNEPDFSRFNSQEEFSASFWAT